jgi:hypothetical protein
MELLNYFKPLFVMLFLIFVLYIAQHRARVLYNRAMLYGVDTFISKKTIAAAILIFMLFIVIRFD